MMAVTQTNPSATSNTGRPLRHSLAWTWFAYTGFLFIEPFFAHSARLWTETLIVFALFAVVFWAYVRGNDKHCTLRYCMIGATLVLGLVLFPVNPGASCLFVYVAGFLPYQIRKTAVVLVLMGVLSALIALEGWLFLAHVGLVNAIIGIGLVWVIGGSNIFFAQEKRSSEKLRAAHEENIALAAVAERERIARDLHDVLGHTLSVIAMKSELAKRLIEADPQRATVEIADVERTARTALAEVREAITGYRTRGLMAEIEEARSALAAAGVALTTDLSAVPAMTPQQETVLALALREAVTNIVRHAQATKAVLRLVSKDGHRQLVIEDDGPNAITREGNGLRGMRERVEALGGTLRVERDAHTRLLMEIPVAP